MRRSPFQPAFRRFETVAGQEVWLRREAVDAIRAVGDIETELPKPITEVHLRGGQTFWLKGDTVAFGHVFQGTAPQSTATEKAV